MSNQTKEILGFVAGTATVLAIAILIKNGVEINE